LQARREYLMDASSENVDPRSRALQQAFLALMEPEVGRRVGESAGMSSESHDLLLAAVETATASPEEREDFMAQAQALAESAVDASWRQIEEMRRNAPGIPVFRTLDTLPALLLGVPLRPFVSTSEATPPGLSRYDIGMRHKVAHGIVGAALTGQPASVGFSGFRMPSERLVERFHVAILQAGAVAGLLLTGTINPEDGCECHTMVTDRIMASLGVGGRDRPDHGPVRTLDEILAEKGLTKAFHDRFVDAWNVAQDLLGPARASGLLDREAEQLHTAGRITIDPVAVAFAVNDIARISAPGTDDLTGPATRMAAMAVAERYVGGGPVHATLSLVSRTPTYRSREHSELTAFTTAFAAVLAGRWRAEQPMSGVAPAWDAVATPEGASTRDRQATSLALTIVKRHWKEIEAAARELIGAGVIDLPACPRRDGPTTGRSSASRPDRRQRGRRRRR
jgi:hypothetical protein